jgi:dipeptidyl aminopeptidase/acylaminoacyl peptidase
LETKEYSNRVLAKNETLILNAFNRSTKEAGFYSKILNEKNDPKRLSMGSYSYNINGISATKANNAEKYIVIRMKSTESPNYFSTSDFKTFIPLSNNYPEKQVNWLSSELITWKALDGNILQGVLYKPENFDPQKKYPIIFYYYEKLSDDLNVYHKPEFSDGGINIPWFVSNGYLIFTPDIHYTVEEPGRSTYNSVVSAAKYLSKFSWVDTAKMGITGHSFGGYETNYLITHSKMFTAAISSSGFSNLISAYGSLTGRGTPYFSNWAEIGQGAIGASLWQRRDLYIKNSPIFKTDKVTTPILLMNNKEDGVVPFTQGIEFFMALRRLGKKAWMLQYDGEKHSLITANSKKDYTIRITQFFNHYLKGEPPPQWMTEGIRASMKGIDDGLRIQYEVKTPGEGLLTPQEKKKVEILLRRMPITITLD